MDALELLKTMITVNTVNPPGNERALAVLLQGLLEEYGFACRLQELGGGRANLIAERSAGEGPELMLNGHLDVVPAPGPWSHDPFDPVIREGRIYGRGACDMKGGIAAMCTAAIRTALKGGPQNGRLKLLFVSDEECSNLGVRRYLSENPGGDYAIIGEPTEMEIAAAHRGVSRDYIDIFGPARHAALPQEGSMSAIKKSAKAIEVIQKMNQALETYRHPLLPSPSIAITMLNGYEKDNVVPGQVRMLTDFRLLPGMKQDEAEAFLRESLSQAGIEGTRITNHFFMPGGEIPLTDPFLKQALEIREAISGRKHKAQPFDASCEQCFLAEAGIKTVICGPGSLSQAHTVDEYLEISQLETAVEFYEAAIETILGTETLKKVV